MDNFCYKMSEHILRRLILLKTMYCLPMLRALKALKLNPKWHVYYSLDGRQNAYFFSLWTFFYSNWISCERNIFTASTKSFGFISNVRKKNCKILEWNGYTKLSKPYYVRLVEHISIRYQLQLNVSNMLFSFFQQFRWKQITKINWIAR